MTTMMRIAAAVAVCVTVLVPAPAAEAADPCAYGGGRFRFVRVTNLSSPLHWEAKTGCDLTNSWHVLGTWDAGAGQPLGTDDCMRGYGWLPAGTYDLLNHADNYAGSAVFGRVWHVQDMRCPNGTIRTELFVHTEETPSNGQNCTTGRLDHNQCWEGPADYASAGCIKVSHVDVALIHEYYYHQSGSSGHGSRSRTLRVEDPPGVDRGAIRPPD